MQSKQQTHYSIPQQQQQRQHHQETHEVEEEEEGWFFFWTQRVYEGRDWENLQDAKVFNLGFRWASAG